VNEIDEDALQFERDIAREPRIVRVPNPVVQHRNKNNKRRGRQAEREWAKLIERTAARATVDIIPPLVRGVLGGADVTWDLRDGRSYAFELKHCRGDWPSSTIIRNAHAQAAKNAGNRTPVVVGCKSDKGQLRTFRVYTDTVMDGPEWIQWVLSA
jgi:hypothetical protein